MILSLLVLLILIASMVHGYHNGLVLELTPLISCIIAWLIASLFTDSITFWLISWDLFPHSYLLHGVCFLILFIVSDLILKRICYWLNLFTNLPVIHLVNSLGGIIAGGIIGYILIALGIMIILALPSSIIQNQYSQSHISQTIVARVVGHAPINRL